MSCRQPSAVAGRAHAEALLHAGVPDLGQVAHRELAGQQLLLDLVALHDVQRVAHLVGIDADQAALHARERAVEVVELPLRPAHAVVLLQERQQEAQERRAAADDHLEQQRLAFLQRHAAIAPHRLVAPARGHAQVVHRVAGLVQRAEQSRERIGARRSAW